MTLRRRLERLESRAGVGAAMPAFGITFWIIGADGEAYAARHLPGNLTIDREDGEAEADFRARAEAAFAA